MKNTGWWCNNHIEKYEFVNGKDDIPYIMENKKCSKPPTSSCAINGSYWLTMTNNQLIWIPSGNLT